MYDKFFKTNNVMSYIKLLLLFLLFFPFIGCEKTETFNNTDTKVGRSRVTFFPTLELIGEQYEAVAVGGTYSEKGAIAKEGGADVQYTTSGTVDVSTPGIYALTYTAVNKDGFSTSLTRNVVVYSTDASAAENDFSGEYARSTNGVIAVWTKLAPGVYKVVNPGGAAGATLTVIAINPTGFTIKIPEQVSSDGNTTFSSEEVYSQGPPATYSWVINNPGYGPALRTFTKQ